MTGGETTHLRARDPASSSKGGKTDGPQGKGGKIGRGGRERAGEHKDLPKRSKEKPDFGLQKTSRRKVSFSPPKQLANRERAREDRHATKIGDMIWLAERERW